ncbi:MAG: M15 family metallopeptidase [Ruminococcus sp.]|nr:M15 family metallopeptidase [Ruminococcus sp.]
MYNGEKIYSDRSRNCAFPYMTQKNGLTYVDGLLIVNKTYSLPSTYGWGLTNETQAAFNEMQQGARADGLSIWICSGFRNYAYQNQLYWNYVARDGSQWSADMYSARAGHSEHQSGLAIDVNQASRYFNGSAVAQWLEKNCWKYGFIIRYPYGKEDKTGYNYESWHVRYVGKEKARRLTESGLCIEEYYGLTSVYS